MSPSHPAEERATEGLQALLVQSNSSDDGDGGDTDDGGDRNVATNRSFDATFDADADDEGSDDGDSGDGSSDDGEGPMKASGGKKRSPGGERSPPPSLRIRIGRMVELPEAQLLVVALLYLDLAAQAVLSAPGWADGPPAPGRGGGSGGPSPPSLLEGWTPVSDALEGLRDFAAACFFLELLLLLLAYGPRRFLSHPGCVMDATAVGAAAAAGPLAAGAAMAALPGLLRPLLRPPPQALVRLLPFLRAWRVVRLCGRSSADGDGGPEEMRRRLEDARAEAAALRARSAALEAGRRREASRRRRAEGQARRTRKEADELGEALLIAAVEAEKMSGDGDGSGRKAEKDADEDGKEGGEEDGKEGGKEDGEETPPGATNGGGEGGDQEKNVERKSGRRVK